MVQSPHFEIRQNYTIFYSNKPPLSVKYKIIRQKNKHVPLSGCPHLQNKSKFEVKTCHQRTLKKIQVDIPNYCDCSAVELGIQCINHNKIATTTI
jgi:hypothetical protein